MQKIWGKTQTQSLSDSQEPTIKFLSMLSKPQEQRAQNSNRSESKSTHACFTKHAKFMTLSVLETSLPMQRSHDTLALDISA